MAKQQRTTADWPIELYEWPEGGDVDYKNCIALLEVPPAGHMPVNGDIVSFFADGRIVRYRVVGREVSFGGIGDEDWLPYSKTWLYVRAMDPDDQPSVLR